MIFAYTLEQVLRGEKSQTRRLIKPEERLNLTGNSIRVEIAGKRTVYEVGKSYAVQPGRGKKAVARIVLTNIRHETVSDISDRDILAEGFLSREAFVETWHSIHGARSNLHVDVWVLEFKVEVIITDELKAFYEQYYNAENRRIDHCHDISTSFTGVSGTYLHSRNHTLR